MNLKPGLCPFCGKYISWCHHRQRHECPNCTWFGILPEFKKPKRYPEIPLDIKDSIRKEGQLWDFSFIPAMGIQPDPEKKCYHWWMSKKANSKADHRYMCCCKYCGAAMFLLGPEIDEIEEELYIGGL